MKWLAGRRAMAVVMVVVGLLWAGNALAEQPYARYSSVRLNKKVHTISPLNTTSALSVLGGLTKNGLPFEPIIWSIEPEGVAKIDPDSGVIKPLVKNGAAVVVATGSVSGKRGVCVLNVRETKLKGFRLNASNLVISPGRSFAFKASFNPSNATFTHLSYSMKTLLNPARPGVRSTFNHETQTLTAGAAEGEMLELTAVAPNGLRAVVRVQVKNVPVSSVKLKKTSATLTVGKTLDLGAKLVVLPAQAADPSVTWASSNDGVAKVDKQGLVTVVGEGRARITVVSTQDPLKKASCAVTGRAVRVSSIKLSSGSAVADPGNSIELSAKISPSTATYQEVVWTSSNEEVATVSEKGKIKVKGAGKAVITAKTDKGKKKDTFTLRVRGGAMKTIKLSAVGDCVIGGDKQTVKKADSLVGDGLTSFKRFEKLYQEKGPGYFFAGVRNIFQNDSVTVVNYEGTLTNSRNRASKTFNFQGPPIYREIARDAGIDVACLANNHAPTDFYQGGYKDTIRNLSSVGIRSFGSGSASATTKTVNGVKIGFVGFVMPVNRADLAKAVRSLKTESRCKLVVVSFHWTKSKEWTSRVTAEERALSRYAISLGADLVLGHHKHLLSGVEKYKGRMIVYDLGNFLTMIRNQLSEGGAYTEKETMIFQQKFNIFEDGYVEYVAPNFIPCMNSESSETMTGNPRVLSGGAGERVLAMIRERSVANGDELVKYSSGY